MRLFSLNPSPILKPYVDKYVFFENEPGIEASSARPIPNGNFILVVNYNRDGIHLKFPKSKEICKKRAYIRGYSTYNVNESPYVVPDDNLQSFGIEFNPLGFYYIFNIPQAEFSNQIIDLVDVFGKEGSQYVEKLLEAACHQEMVRITEDFLITHLLKNIRQSRDIDYSIGLIKTNHGLISISKLCEELNIGRRTLERYFQYQIGISPKALSRILRFNYCHRLFLKNPLIDWQEIVYKCGYYDQAHFIRDFKEITGDAPNQYLNQRSFLWIHSRLFYLQ